VQQRIEEGEEEVLHARDLLDQTPEVTPNIEARINAIRGGGQPLPGSTRAFFEPRFGQDFSQVRLHTDTRAAESARAVNARAFTTGRDVVFGAGQYAPGTSEGRRLMAHELVHVVQQEHLSLPSINTNELDKEPTGSKNEQEADQLAKQFLIRNVEELSIKNMLMSDLMLLQCRCLPDTECLTSIPGSPEEFELSETTREAPHRTRRAQMVRSGSPLGSHGGRARQLEIFLDNQIGSDSVRTSNIHGIFVDQDLSEGTGAYLSPCNQITPPIPGATLPCVFVHGQMNRQAFQFNQTTAPMIDGRTREEWRVDTLALLTHEAQHAIFGRWSSPTPGSVSGSCSWNHVEYSLSELSALMSEFPVYFREIPSNADAAHSARVRLNQWFDEVINNPYEYIRGALIQLRCLVPCSCSDIDSYIRDTFNFTSSSWSQDEKDAFHRELLQRNLNWPMQPQTP
jgi:hypothetical protein